jgi:hypothetical protein
MPDGTIWNGLRRLRKDNTGYCLRQLFVGSEGTSVYYCGRIETCAVTERSRRRPVRRRNAGSGFRPV